MYRVSLRFRFMDMVRHRVRVSIRVSVFVSFRVRF